MTSRRRITICVAVMFAMAAGLRAQTTTTTKEAGQTQVTTEQITGEVVLVDGNILLARMQPSGQYRMFNIQPSQQFMIDGKPKRLTDLTPGTFLTATATHDHAAHHCPHDDRHQRHGVVCPGQLRDSHNRQRPATGVHRSRLVYVHFRGQACDGQRSEEGHEGLGHEDRRDTNL